MGRQLFGMRSGVEVALSGNAFIGGDIQNAVAAQNSHVQLYNQPTSTRTLVVRRIVVRPAASVSVMRLTSFATALTTLSTALSNKKLKGPDPQGEVRTQTNAGILGVIIQVFRVAGTVTYEVLLKDDPIIVTPGNGIVVADGTVNESLTVGFEWVEIDA